MDTPTTALILIFCNNCINVAKCNTDLENRSEIALKIIKKKLLKL